MRKFFLIYFLPIFIFLSFVGCSKEDLVYEDKEDESEVTQIATDLSSKLALNSPGDDSEFAYVLLDPSKSISSQLVTSKTIYELTSDFDLKGGEITIPANSILRFNGGSIKNALVTFDNTYIEGLVMFSGCSFSGSLYNKEVALSWFGASTSSKDNSTVINQVLKIIPETLVLDGLYAINSSIVIPKSITIRGIDWSENVYATQVENSEYGIKTSSNITAIKFDVGGSLNLYGVSIIGNSNLYIGGNTREGISTCGVFLYADDNGVHGSLTAMRDCSIVGFTYGIRSIGGYIERINRTYFSACRFGLYTAYTSDYICEDCHFNTNMLNYNLSAAKIDDTNPNAIRKVGAGVCLKGSSMTQFVNCRFEYNFIHFLIDEAATIVNVENCLFDAATHSCIMLFNEKNEDNSLPDSEIHNPSINGINILGNTFARGARCERYQNTTLPGSGIIYVREGDNRGSNITFSNNIIVDDVETDQVDVNYEETIFRIYNTSEENGVINSNSNDFSHCKAKTVAAAVTGSEGRYVIKDHGSNYGDISHEFQNNSVIDIQKMDVLPNGQLIIWNTLTNGDEKSVDTIVDPNN